MWQWIRREPPLAPSAVLARGEAAAALVRSMRALPLDTLSELRAVVGAELIIVSGTGEALPWADGVVYLGIDPKAPALRMPTWLMPTLPVALLERAILARLDLAPPVACVGDELFSLAMATTIPVDAFADRLTS